MTFTPHQLQAAASHLAAAARHASMTSSRTHRSRQWEITYIRSSLLLGELEKAARALGYRLEKNGGHEHDDEDGSD